MYVRSKKQKAIAVNGDQQESAGSTEYYRLPLPDDHIQWVDDATAFFSCIERILQVRLC